MMGKHIKISITIMVLALIGLSDPCIAQDTICTTGLMGKIIKNSDGTFFYTSNILVDNGGHISTLSYGRWRALNDSVFEFTSSVNTKHEILQTYELYDSITEATGLIIDVRDENGYLLCKWNDSDVQFYAESSVLGISVCDTAIQLHGVSPYGQWHLSSIITENMNNHYIVVIRDALYYNLEYLCFSIIKKKSGIWQLLQTTKR